MVKVAKVEVNSVLKGIIKRTVDELGGMRKFVKKGEVVFLKLNCNTADPFPASTDLEFLRAVVELVYEAGAKLVMVGDSSTMTLNTHRIMEQKGLFRLSEEMPTPPRIYDLDEGEWVKKVVPRGRYLKNVSLPSLLERADRIIYLPCLKTHKQAQYTGALKLSIGFVKPFERVSMHLKNLQEKIAELNTLIRSDLVIMDARMCFITGGPSMGELREPNLIMASTGRAAIDIEGVKTIQNFNGNSLTHFEPESLPQIKLALELGID
jgi:uncharacterized protein (DUF362 family)